MLSSVFAVVYSLILMWLIWYALVLRGKRLECQKEAESLLKRIDDLSDFFNRKNEKLKRHQAEREHLYREFNEKINILNLHISVANSEREECLKKCE